MVDPLHAKNDRMNGHYWLLLFALVMTGCSSQDKKLRKRHLNGEYLFRLHNEYFFTPFTPQQQLRCAYPWEEKMINGIPRITKEFFRCKGNASNHAVIQQREGKDPLKYFDCEGSIHGLPLRNGKEFIYPCLIDILNFIQQKTGKKVVITCGHRCPKHNQYSDLSPSNWNSKHMLGAEVDFYVESHEHQPENIISLIQQYYAATDSEFQRYTAKNLNVSIDPWYNKEILIKLYQAHEGRDRDNQHPYPYLGIQVRFDKDLKANVVFDPKQSQNYLRH